MFQLKLHYLFMQISHARILLHPVNSKYVQTFDLKLKPILK